MRWWQGTDPGLISGSLVISIGLHLLVAVYVLAGLGASQPAAPPVLTVSLVAPEPPGPAPGSAGSPTGGQAGTGGPPHTPPVPVPKVAAPPPVKEKPKKRQVRPRALAEPVEPGPLIAPRPTPPPPVVKTPTPTAAAVQPAPATPAAGLASLRTPEGARAAGGNAPASAGSAQAGAGSGGSSRAAWGSSRSMGHGPGAGINSARAQSTYVNLIRSRIISRRQYPYLARQRREEGVVRLRFTISSGGSLVQGVQVVTPSGSQLLDDQARQCVLSAGPFPPLPLELRREALTLEVPIVYKLTDLGL